MLPTEHDFDSYGGCLDAQSAWKHFGGLNLKQAYELFCENPSYYQEDFMFMGHGALAYYFPVLDKYLRTCDDDGQALIIAQGLELQFQFDNDDITKIDKLRTPIVELARFVVQNIENYGETVAEREQISCAWRNLEAKLA